MRSGRFRVRGFLVNGNRLDLFTSPFQKVESVFSLFFSLLYYSQDALMLFTLNEIVAFNSYLGIIQVAYFRKSTFPSSDDEYCSGFD